jgi:hypothetical protein
MMKKSAYLGSLSLTNHQPTPAVVIHPLWNQENEEGSVRMGTWKTHDQLVEGYESKPEAYYD